MNLSAIETATKGKVRTGGISSFSDLELDKVHPNPNQPRKSFTDIDELAASIKTNGLIQPIAVVKTNGKYMIISGERRYRACKELGLKIIKAHIIQADEKKILELALVENIQRDDLTDFEKAKFINQLWATDNYAKKQDLATAIGKPAIYLSKVFKAVKICDEIVKDIEANKKDIGLEVLQELSSVKDKSIQLRMYQDGTKRDDIRDYNQSQKSSKISRAKKEPINLEQSLEVIFLDTECVCDDCGTFLSLFDDECGECDTSTYFNDTYSDERERINEIIELINENFKEL